MKNRFFPSLILLSTVLAVTAPSAFAQNDPPVPHITDKTVRVDVGAETHIESVGEGIVTLWDYNNGVALYSLEKQAMLGGFDWKVARTYNETHPFSGGACLLIRQKDRRWAIVKPDGSYSLLSEKVTDGGIFVDGLSWIQNGDDWTYISKDGKAVLSEWGASGRCERPEMRPLKDGLRAVQNIGSRLWGFVDAAGKTVIPAKYKNVSDFGEGRAFFTMSGNRWGIIDKNGNEVVPEGLDLGWDAPCAFSQGWALIPAKQKYIDLQGNAAAADCDGLSFDKNGRSFLRSEWSALHMMDAQMKDYGRVGGEERKLRLFNDFDQKGFTDGCAILMDYDFAYIFQSDGTLRLRNQELIDFTGIYPGGYVAMTYGLEKSGRYAEGAAVSNLDGEILVVFDRAARFGHVRKAGTIDPEAAGPAPEKPVKPEELIEETIIEPQPPEEPPVIEEKEGEKKNGGHNGGEEEEQDPPRQTFPEYKLTLVADPEEGGTVTSSWDRHEFEKQYSYNAAAKANKDWEFSHWTSNIEGKVMENYATSYAWVSQDVTLTAHFKKIVKPEVLLTVKVEGGAATVHRTKAPIYVRDTVRIIVLPEVKGSILGWEYDSKKFRTVDAEGYVLTLVAREAGEQTVIARLSQPEELEEAGLYCVSAHRSWKKLDNIDSGDLEADVYLVSAPRGKSFDTPMGPAETLFGVYIKPGTRHTVYMNDKPIPQFAATFLSPAVVNGVKKEENGKTYLYFTGYATVVGYYNPEYEDFVKMIVSFASERVKWTDGDKSYYFMTPPHRYRIDIQELPGGRIRLGTVQRFSASAGGWIVSDAEQLRETKRADLGSFGYVKVSENLINSDMYEGLVLEPVKAVPPVEWYPGRVWYESDAQYQKAKACFDRFYANPYYEPHDTFRLSAGEMFAKALQLYVSHPEWFE